MTTRAACDMLVSANLRKGVRGQKAKRNKTAILLRLSRTHGLSQLRRQLRGSGEPGEGFGSGTPTAVFMWSCRTQQNNTGFCCASPGKQPKNRPDWVVNVQVSSTHAFHGERNNKPNFVALRQPPHICGGARFTKAALSTRRKSGPGGRFWELTSPPE